MAMSDPYELALATVIMRHLLTQGLATAQAEGAINGDIAVTAVPPDRAETGADERQQLNLFLYHVIPNLAWKQGSGRGGQLLDLHYLLTAYGPGELQGELLLGQALAILQRAERLDAKQLADMLGSVARAAGGQMFPPALAALIATPERLGLARIEIHPQFPTMEEISRLWSAFQARYRPSVAYKVSMVTK